MKRMTKNLVKTLLMGDYMDALAYFASKLEKYDDIENDFMRKMKIGEALEKIDETVWQWCDEYEEDFDFMEVWLCIYSALKCAC